jgi:predicted ATPase
VATVGQVQPAPTPGVALTSIDGYRIIGLLGRGGFGTVYRAADEGGRSVAIKVARADQPGASDRLDREVEALRAVGAPHVPLVHRSGRLADGASYAVLEFISASTLADVLASPQAPFSAAAFAACAEQLLDALEAVHARGLIHCDLKPENVFLEQNPARARLFDFGLVRSSAEPQSAPPSGDGAIEGTPEYMSPEQCSGLATVDPRSDIYSLGVILYEMLTGYVPFFGTAADVQEAHRSKRPTRFAQALGLSPLLENAVLRCLAKAPGERFQTAASLRDALRQATAESRPATSPVQPGAPVSATAPSSAPAREKRTVGMVFFHGTGDAASVQSAVMSFGGELGYAAGHSYVAVFGEKLENPARRALIAARAITARTISDRALVHLAQVTIQARSGGGRRYMSPLFTRADRFPQEGDPPGVLVTDSASKSLPELALEEISGRPGILRLVAERQGEEQATIVKQGAGPLIGREDVLASLLESARKAAEGGLPTIATVIAEAGHGKSHLCTAMLDQLEGGSAKAQLLQLRAREPVGGDADETLKELLTRLLRLPKEPPKDAGHALMEERLGPELGKELWAGVALIFGWVSADAPELRGLAAAPGVLRAAAARAAGTALRQWAQAKPLWLVLDDAQFADEATLDAIEFACLAEAQAPIWACILARPAFEAGRPNWADRCADRSYVRLGPLSPEGSASLCRSLLLPAENVPVEAIERLVARTQGIPLLLVELVRALKNEGLIRQGGRGQGWYLATDELDRVPDLPLVEWLASRELESLPADLAAHARLAALLGSEFTALDISGVLQELERDGSAHSFPLDAAVGTQRLMAGGVLIPRRHGQLSFRHALVRDAVYRSVPESLRKPIHEAALRFYRERSAGSEAERLPHLAFHAARCGRRDEATGAYLRLAERAQSRHAYLEAESMFTQALEQMSETSESRVQGCRGRGLMRYRLGRYEDACKDFSSARTLAHQLRDSLSEVDILLDEATALDWAEEFRRSKALVDEAHQMAAHIDHPLLQARLLMGMGRSHHRLNQDVEAGELLERAANRAEALGDEAYETYVISQLLNGYIFASLGRLDDSARAFDGVIPLCTERGDRLHLGAALLNRFMLRTCRNEQEQLLDDLRRVLELGREMGNGRMEQQAEFYLTLYLRWLNRLDEAEKHAKRAVEIDERRLGSAARPESALLLARVLAARGDDGGARAILEAIRARQRRARERNDRELELLPAEDAIFTMVDLATREAPDSDWDALQQRAASCLDGQQLIEILEMRARAAQRSRRPDRAREAFEQAFGIATRVPNVMRDRIERELAQMRRAEA